MINPRDEILRKIRECHVEHNAISDSTPIVDEDDVDSGMYDEDGEDYDFFMNDSDYEDEDYG